MPLKTDKVEKKKNLQKILVYSFIHSLAELFEIFAMEMAAILQIGKASRFWSKHETAINTLPIYSLLYHAQIHQNFRCFL